MVTKCEKVVVIAVIGVIQLRGKVKWENDNFLNSFCLLSR